MSTLVRPEEAAAPATVSAERAAEGEVSRPNGEAVAAMLAGGLGLLALGGTNLLAAGYQPIEEALLRAGQLFLPGGVSLSVYGGKELVALLVWLGSWALLHWCVGRRQVSLAAAVGLFMGLLMLATALLWPPFVSSLVRLLL